MAKEICVIGTGYVGLIAAVGLSDFGNYVTGVDIDPKKIDSLNKGILPIYEPGVEPYLKRNLQSGRLKFTVDIDKALSESQVIFLAVGTPPKKDGSADLAQVESVINSIVKNLNGYKVIVTKSTVPVGTNRWIYEKLKEKAPTGTFDVVSNPEFLREGKAIQDFFHPDRLVVGHETGKAREVMEDVYRSLFINQTPMLFCNWETAELIKYASNAFLAVKISFINEMANLADAVGGDVKQIAKAMGMDGRISSKFLHPGPGYGGSCFPKDTQAIVATGKKYQIDMSVIRQAIDANEKQKHLIVKKLQEQFGTLEGKKITLLGLAFKAETDDIRESSAIAVVEDLLESGAQISCTDPQAIDNFQAMFPQCSYNRDSFEALTDADICIILTDWNEYRNIDLQEMGRVMNEKVIFDVRNILKPSSARAMGFTYLGHGVQS